MTPRPNFEETSAVEFEPCFFNCFVLQQPKVEERFFSFISDHHPKIAGLEIIL